MTSKEIILQDEPSTLTMHPKKFALWLFIVSITMMFAALTSAYIVRQSEGDWLDITLPNLMWGSSFIIVLSSISMHWSYLSAKKDNFQFVNLGIILTTLLGFMFLVTQFMAWEELVKNNVFFAGKASNPAGSFLYVLTGLHGFHIVTGLIFLLIALYQAIRLNIHSKNTTLISMCATYWHFLGGLWLYLFVFFYYIR